MDRMNECTISNHSRVRASVLERLDLEQMAFQTMLYKTQFEAEQRHRQKSNKTQFESEERQKQNLNYSETNAPRDAWFLFQLRRPCKDARKRLIASSTLMPSMPADFFSMELSLDFTVADVQELIGFYTPDIVKHESRRKGIESTFCRVSAQAKHQILQNFPEISETNFKAYGPARKDLSPPTMYPSLGFEKAKPLSGWLRKEPLNLLHQDQYPVYYFLYSPLDDPECLSEILDLEEEPEYYPARIEGGELTRCHSVYQELIDWAGGEEIGFAYEVRSREDELKLLHFQTDQFEVVRTTIQMAKDSKISFVNGLTFRYIQDFSSAEVGL